MSPHAGRGPIGPLWWGPPLAGVGLALAFPPLDALPLALVGWWPFLAFLDRTPEGGWTWRRAFAGGYLFGLAYFGVILYWVAGLSGFSAMAVPAYLVSVAGLAVNAAGVAVAVHVGRRAGVPMTVSFPLAWVAVEWLRSFGDLGVTWAMVADAVTAYPLLLQTAELGGAWLVALWLVASATALYRLAFPLPSTRRAAASAVAVALVAVGPAYGALRIAQLDAAAAEWPTLRVAAIQPDVPQDRKWDEAFEAEIHRRLATLTARADRFDPALVVWPESAVPGFLRYDPRTRAFVEGLAARIDAPIFTGTNDADTLSGRSGDHASDYRVYNAAYLVRPGSIVPRRYAKRRLVPVAERVPFVPDLATGLFRRLSAWTGQFSTGEGWPTWSVEGVGFGAMICYESVFPDVSRSLVRAGADFLLNITNDAWFGPTAAPYQHASHLALRAVEHRVAFLRAANSGISGWVDPVGRYRARTGLYRTAVVVAEIPAPGIETPYTRWGDWLPAVCLAAWAGLVLVGRLRRR